MDRNERIRARAHEIWESEGRPEGRESEHWMRAEAEISDEEVAEGPQGAVTLRDAGADVDGTEVSPEEAGVTSIDNPVETDDRIAAERSDMASGDLDATPPVDNDTAAEAAAPKKRTRATKPRAAKPAADKPAAKPRAKRTPKE
ncbi:DUF2934 domain-containing protein [Paracoccus rhizosphaerae]|uniref:DUF2934 domain-containing protein n=1 Tax=Paracoccus rhizosphaerae TaxID=1133347 RepID=A0ABV6CN03_9RHOB|nr:DUF2934 domain-containing protein [Paracoccus rhizosphaerae]